VPWTYSGNPKSSPKDEVRFLIGDTDDSEPLLQDEEIKYILTVTPSAGTSSYNYGAAAVAAKSIAAKFARERDKTVGSLSLRKAQRYDQYLALANDLLDMAGGAAVVGLSRPPGAPVLGGGGPTYLGGNWP